MDAMLRRIARMTLREAPAPGRRTRRAGIISPRAAPVSSDRPRAPQRPLLSFAA